MRIPVISFDFILSLSLSVHAGSISADLRFSRTLLVLCGFHGDSFHAPFWFPQNNIFLGVLFFLWLIQSFCAERVVTYSTNFSTSTMQIPFLDNFFLLENILSSGKFLSLFSDYWFSFCFSIHGGDKAQGVLVFHKMPGVVSNNICCHACTTAPACVSAYLDPGAQDCVRNPC